MTYRLHCFGQSGNSFKVAALLRVLQQPWQPVHVDFMHGATREPAWRERTNEMGEVPVLEDGTRRLTQSGLILQHLARKHGAYAGRTQEEQDEVQRWILFDNHKFTSYFASYRFALSFAPSAPEPTVMAWLKGRIDGAWGIVEKHLADRPFLVGDAPTIADFSLNGYLHYPPEESGYDLPTRFPAMAAWTARMRALPGWAAPYEIMPGERIAPKWTGRP